MECGGEQLGFLLQVVIRGKDEVAKTGRLPDLRSAAQGLRLIDMPGAARPPAPLAAKSNNPVQFPMQFGGPPMLPVPGQSPLATLVRTHTWLAPPRPIPASACG